MLQTRDGYFAQLVESGLLDSFNNHSLLRRDTFWNQLLKGTRIKVQRECLQKSLLVILHKQLRNGTDIIHHSHTIPQGTQIV